MKTVRTWWGKKFIEALEGFIDPGRLQRGKGYANENRITQWAMEGNRITARIRGNANPYYGVYKEPLYTTFIELKAIGAGDWRKVIAQLGGQAAFVSRLLLNEVPDTIEEPFEELGLRLLPLHVMDMKTQCSCPDYANPCKHIAGLDFSWRQNSTKTLFCCLNCVELPVPNSCGSCGKPRWVGYWRRL